jgi:8-oxo-dGTP diphosphatase
MNLPKTAGLPRVGVAVIVRKRHLVLMGLRQGSHGAGTWSFPGGHVEPSETVEETAARKLREETGIGIAPEQLRKVAFTQDWFADEGKHYITLFLEPDHEMKQEPRCLEPDKCERWLWMSHREAGERSLFLPIVNLLRDFPGSVWRTR